jgi:signal transduction histidine kinase
VLSVLQIGIAALVTPGAFSTNALWLVLTIALNAGVALMAGYASHTTVRAIHNLYEEQANKRKESEQKLQQQERDHIKALYHLINTLSATLNYQVVLNTALDLSMTALGSSDSPSMYMVSAVLLFGEHDLAVGASRRLTAVDQRAAFPAEKGALRNVLETGESKLVNDPSHDAELARLVALRGCQSAVVVPLRRALNFFGVLLYAHPDPHFFTPDRVETLEIIGNQMVIAIQNARLYQDLEHEKEQIMDTQDEARKKLARDLHDGPTQGVSAITMRIGLVRKMLQTSPNQVDQQLALIEDLARRTSTEIRHMLFTLRPLVLETDGLEAALRTMAQKMQETFQQNVAVEVNQAVVKQLEIGRQTVVFYLVEEALNNARKHAKAAQIWVRLNNFAADPGFALLEIADNGVGFDVSAINKEYEKRGSLGMVNLRERTELLNGLLNIDSAPGMGTRVQIYIPLTDEAADRMDNGQFKI